MEKSVYNLQQIVKIVVEEKRESTRFRYQPAKSYLFGLVKDKEGFCPIQVVATNEVYTKEQLEAGEYLYSDSKYVVEGTKVYLKPRVVIYFVSDYRVNIVCDTNEEAYKRLEDIKKIAMPITLDSYN